MRAPRNDSSGAVRRPVRRNTPKGRLQRDLKASGSRIRDLSGCGSPAERDEAAGQIREIVDMARNRPRPNLYTEGIVIQKGNGLV